MPKYTEQPPALRRVQYDPDPDGGVKAQAFFETVLVNDDNSADRIPRPWQPVEFTLPPELAEQIRVLAAAALPPA